ncbi:ABC transporter ATP-binding protein [Mycoplasma procyoni]|uniref:ABC transporter ATP-binding protein n=1 Tax=Mycoplasma procyoni TaxID=568784 RepID=UPI00197C79B7|nr:ABC transporter ATP-binding protein [Mycoplasma procyoni]MBN3534485.1 ABC transporter ATP-binding protein [Mycoplasma procyoni]
MENNHILQLKNLTKIYPKSDQGVKDISFSVHKGTFHAFIGENGAGKTTTIKTIIDAFSSYQGEVLIDGKDHRSEEAKSKIGYVPENALFPKGLTSFEYLVYLAELSKIKRQDAKQKIDELLEKFGILELKNKKPYSFSSGQKKKILLIQALIHDPEILILDEPAANLDPSARYELFKILTDLNKAGKTIFISSHILKEIDEFTSYVTLIHKGKIYYHGPKNEKTLEELFYEKVIKTDCNH